MIKAVIFDVDGVLIDNTSLIVEIFQEDARRGGVRVPDKKEVINFLGLPWMDIVEKLLGKDEKYKKIHCEVWHEYENRMNFMPDAEEVLSKLKQDKAIVTSKPKDNAEKQLKDILSHFKFIVAMEDTKKHKPDPEPLLKACKQLNIRPKEVVYIGDCLRDFEMARNSGVDFVGMLSGAASEEEFKKAGAKRLIASLSELPNIINFKNKF